jgi:hypothetical protein
VPVWQGHREGRLRDGRAQDHRQQEAGPARRKRGVSLENSVLVTWRPLRYPKVYKAHL